MERAGERTRLGVSLSGPGARRPPSLARRPEPLRRLGHPVTPPHTDCQQKTGNHKIISEQPGAPPPG
jgi:hypothetical protein